MPSTIQTSWRTKQVTTYGRRNKNVVPVFDIDDPKTASNAESISYVEDIVLSPESVQSRPKPKAKRVQNLVASHSQGSTHSPASSKKHSDRGARLYYDGPPSPRRPSLSVTPGRVPLAAKGDANTFDSPRIETVRGTALKQKFVNTSPARKASKKAVTLNILRDSRKDFLPHPFNGTPRRK
ncbi:hypothetical protein BS47DRAFT_840834 [Hydnum rufescens UP504]|uniref:Uncharacterized protein n=1 Tax=Hydnum rufescens UP504 TaxID=1448309 RepID=A0A9P6AZA3_9AGAM|nr:hypothetical protein BS47DRAFT_840834 [Hydnum rufescens UP504]